MNWNLLTDAGQIDELIKLSGSTPVLIFKHSTRCSISSMAKYRLEDDWDFLPDQLVPYLLDLIALRSISNAIAETVFGPP